MKDPLPRSCHAKRTKEALPGTTVLSCIGDQTMPCSSTTHEAKNAELAPNGKDGSRFEQRGRKIIDARRSRLIPCSFSSADMQLTHELLSRAS